jgi:hypothetical protein
MIMNQCPACCRRKGSNRNCDVCRKAATQPQKERRKFLDELGTKVVRYNMRTTGSIQIDREIGSWRGKAPENSLLRWLNGIMSWQYHEIDENDFNLLILHRVRIRYKFRGHGADKEINNIVINQLTREIAINE